MSEVFGLRNVERSFGTRFSLRVPDLTIGEGETLGVIGPSGAGKTTLLRILAMLDTPSSGEICYRGTSIQSSIPIGIRRELTMVFQRPEVLDQSVQQNVEYGLKVRGLHEPVLVREMLEQLGIEHLADQPAMSLSGGEAQRVAVARALVLRPSVLLLDEPTANLDPENVAIIERAICTVKQREGVTVVLVSHNLYQVRRLATHLAGIIDGELVDNGPTGQVLNNAEDRRFREFISGGITYWGD